MKLTDIYLVKKRIPLKPTSYQRNLLINLFGRVEDDFYLISSPFRESPLKFVFLLSSFLVFHLSIFNPDSIKNNWSIFFTKTRKHVLEAHKKHNKIVAELRYLIALLPSRKKITTVSQTDFLVSDKKNQNQIFLSFRAS